MGGGGGGGRSRGNKGGYVAEGGSGGESVGGIDVGGVGGGSSSRKNSTTLIYIKNWRTGLVLDVREVKDSEVIMGNYHGGPNQLWEYKNGMIYSKLNGFVLEEMQGSSSVCISKPHGWPNQFWYFEADGKIRNKDGKHLSVTASGIQYKLSVGSKDISKFSTFMIIPVCCNHVISDTEDPAVNGGGGSGGSSGGGGGRGGRAHYNTSFSVGGSSNVGSSRNNTMLFYIMKNGLVLDVKKSIFPEVIMETYHGGPNQLWEYKNGMIYSKLNGLVLEVEHGSRTVGISRAHGELNQLWDFEGNGRIRSKLGLVLDVGKGKIYRGTHVFVCTKSDERLQKFRIVPVSG